MPRMSDGERRRRGRLVAREKRDRAQAARLQTAHRCPKRHGSGVCNGPLRTTTDTIGGTVVICEWCERQRANTCRYCNRRCATPGPNALYCVEHRHQVRRRQEKASYQRHAAAYRKTDREKYWSNDERRLRSAEYKRLWRKANPEKVRAQKKRYVQRMSANKSSWYVRYHAKYRKQYAQHRRELVNRLNSRQRKPIPNCKSCGRPTGWEPVPGRTGGRPWNICMKCRFPSERKLIRKHRRAAVKKIAADPRFGLPPKPVRVRRPKNSPPRGPGDERICVTDGCDIVLTHRKKRCTKCQRRDAEFALQELAKTRRPRPSRRSGAEVCGMSDVHSRTELQRNGESHRHVCAEVSKRSTDVCSARGYCQCECGATKGTNCLSEWVKSTAGARQ